MLREFTCIMCPRGCEIVGELVDGSIGEIKGNACPKGAEYVRGELTNPMRNITTSVKVNGKEAELVSVRLNRPVPKDKIFAVMEAIRGAEVQAPTHIGDVVIENVLNLGSDVIITKNVK